MAHYFNNNTASAVTAADPVPYRAMAYYRLSKDDKEKFGSNESDSIANQRKLIAAYLKNHEDIELADEAYDDGYTGTNYDRPGFCSVMEAIEKKEVNCVIVKDLSRLGREYIQTGKYLEEIFPSMGVRFIAVADNVDSICQNDSDDIIIPVKNIVNESYCRMLSRNLRRQFYIQRSNGEYVGSFTRYGYVKDPADKHKLIVDEYAAAVVHSIFELKLCGYSQQGIADYLNSERILPPAEYKRTCLGLNYRCGFKKSDNPQWTVNAVRRILSDPIYIGTLVQGKRGTRSFKSKKVEYRSEDMWVTVEDNHPAIIDKHLFSAVNQMLERDTKRSPQKAVVEPLAGLVFCGDCKSSMTLRTSGTGEKKYSYYICSSAKNRKSCTWHSFERTKLERAVLEVISEQIRQTVELDKLLQELNSGTVASLAAGRIMARMKQKEKDLERTREIRMKLYEYLSEGLLEKDEYITLRERYSKDIEAEEEALDRLCGELEKAKVTGNAEWVQNFVKYKDVSSLTRELTVSLIERIYVYEDKHLEVVFRYRNERDSLLTVLENEAKEAG